MNKRISLLLLVALPFCLFAAKITGTVKDAKDGSPLIGAIVNIKNTNKAATTDVDGNYELKDVEDGSYELIFSLITYKKQTEKLTVSGNQDIVVDINLKSEEKNVLKDVSVSGTKITRTENAVLMEIKKSSSIVSGIGAAQIGKTMDRNAADVVKRIPGVTIQDDRFIVVRGLADRYNTVWLNDASTPSSETDKKAFSFDLIPSGLIDRVLVYKTPSPELPGDFAGGMVKVYTTSMPDKNGYSVGLQTSWRQNSTGTSFNYEPRSSTDWLGYDDGKRSLPNNLPDQVKATDPNSDVISKSFGSNNWTIKNKTLAPDTRVNLSTSNVFKIRKVKIANTFGASYSNVSTNYEIERRDWDSVYLFGYHYKDKRSENKISTGLLDNLAVVASNSKIEFKNLYNQLGKATITERTNVPDTLAVSDEKGYYMTYEGRATYCSELSGTHRGNSDKWKYNWTIGYTDMFRNMPDTRRLNFIKTTTDTAFHAQTSAAGDPYRGGGIYYAKLFENTYSFNHQFSYKVRIDNYTFDVNIGNYFEYKKRDFQSRLLSYQTNSKVGAGGYQFDKSLNYLPVDQIFADENIGKGKFLLTERVDSNLQYSAKNALIASFLSVKLSVGERINIVGGARYEQNSMSMMAWLSPTQRIEPGITTKYLLPSVNASYNFNEKSLVRVAYGKTLNRPEFREWAPSQYYDWENLNFIYGSLYPTEASSTAGQGDTLKVGTIDNIDARWEWYPSAGEMVHAGVFYKKITNPIQLKVLNALNRTYTFVNEKEAYTAGFELDFRKSLLFADDLLNTKVFKDLMLAGNITLTKSQLTTSQKGIGTKFDELEHTPLVGQSPYTLNLGVFYLNNSLNLQGSLLYNVCGPRMYAIGKNVRLEESLGELPFHSLDLTLQKTFFKYYSVNIGIQNLLDSKVVFVKDADRNGKLDDANDREYKNFKPSRYFSLGLKVKF